MDKVKKIMECESAYTRCFSRVDENEEYITYRDMLLPDMYDHNYTRIREHKKSCGVVEMVMIIASSSWMASPMSNISPLSHINRRSLDTGITFIRSWAVPIGI